MTAITPFLWFNDQAEEAAHFYTSIFKNGKINAIVRYGPGGMGQAGSVMTVAFELDGHPFTALNGGPVYSFSHATSFVIHCKDQAEVDYYWEKLLEGGRAEQCGWLTDKFGVTWQVVPDGLTDLLQDPDPARVERVTKAMLAMVKLDIDAMCRAADQQAEIDT